MALRTAQTLLGTFIRAGVFCLAPDAVSCFAHGLPATPDSIMLTAITTTANAAGSSIVFGGSLQSWDATSCVFNNSSSGRAYYVRAAVEHSIIS